MLAFILSWLEPWVLSALQLPALQQCSVEVQLFALELSGLQWSALKHYFISALDLSRHSYLL